MTVGARPGVAEAPLAVEIGGRRLSIRDLAHINRMTTIEQVLPNTAHEINNALQVVGGLAEMLSARPDLPDAAVEKLGRMVVQVNRATALVRELVAFTRREHASVCRLDVTRPVEAALSLRRYHLSRDRVKVSLAACCEPPPVCLVDGHYLQQALVNLLINAERALRGEPDPTLAVRVEPSGDAIAIAVEDNGRGLCEEAAARAGEPFFSTDAHTLGLGVAVARSLVEMQGGRLELEPHARRGTCARVILPRADA